MMFVLKQQIVKIINELIKKLIIAWDSDFSRVTLRERIRIDNSVAEMERGIHFTEEDVWD